MTNQDIRWDPRLAISIHLVLISLLGMVAFFPVDTYLLLGYFLLTLIFIYPVVHSSIKNLDKKYQLYYILILPIITMLLVIDPVEQGLVGYDSYKTLYHHNLFLDGPATGTFISNTQSFPAFFSFTVILERIGVPQEFLSKYIPLIAAITPLFLYISFQDRLPDRPVFLLAIAFSSTRGLYINETKFVDETLAVTLLFCLFVIELAYDNQTRDRLLVFLIVLAISLTHHLITFITIFLFIVWKLVAVLSKSTYFKHVFFLEKSHYNCNHFQRRSLGYMEIIVPIGIFTFIFLYYLVDLTESLLLQVASILLLEGAGEPVPTPGSGESFVATIAGSVVVVYALFALVDSYGFSSKKRLPTWAYAWIIIAGILSITYASLIFMGRAIPLTPDRLIIILVPTLISPAIYIIYMADHRIRISPDIIARLLVIVLITTHLFAIPPNILYSNPDNIEMGGHYSPSQFASSDWASEYRSSENIKIIGYESELWMANGIHEFELKNSNSARNQECQNSNFYVWRNDIGGTSYMRHNTVYSNDGVRTYMCR